MKRITKPIIIIGSGRSGTTIISEIVFRHEALAWPSNYIDRYPSMPLVNLFRNLYENRLWRLEGQKPQLNKVSRINKILFKPSEAYNFWEYITGPRIDFSRNFLINEQATDPEIQKVSLAFQQIALYQLKEKVAFKITGPSRIGYLQSIFPDPIFINIVRDPIPTIKSLMKVGFWQTNGLHRLWWQGAYTEEEQQWALRNAANGELLTTFQYKRVMDVTDMEIKKYNTKCLNVRYEDFVRKPADVITQILDFAELSHSKHVFDYMRHNKIYDRNTPSDKKNSFQLSPEAYKILESDFNASRMMEMDN